MLDADRDNWEDIETGAVPATWATFLGVTVGATHLTPPGAALVPRVAADLTQWFGRDWLPTAIGPGAEGRIPWLRRFSPTMSLNGDIGAAAAFIEVVGWWAALMTQTDAHGIAQVRKDLRRDVSIARLLHTLTQTRLAAMATAAGMQVTFEPRPGDLLLQSDGTEVTVEVFAMRPAADLDRQTELSNRMFAVVDESSRRHRVHFSGQLPTIETDMDEWGVWVEQQAADVGRHGIALALRWDESEVLVAPGDAPTGVELVGPSIEVDVGSRIRERVSHKARQVESAPAAWLWVENHGAVDLLSPVASASLLDQLDAFRALLWDAAVATASVQGLTFSSAGRRRWPPVGPERVVAGVSRAAVHPVPLDRARTTYHLPGVDGPVSSVMWRLVEQDSTWLDVTLMKLGSPPVAKLVKTS